MHMALETCTDDNILAMASFLLPKELVNLALVCKLFGGKNVAAARPAAGKRRREGRPWSAMEEASRRRVSAAKNDRHDPWRDSDLIMIWRKESWMAVDHRLHLLRSSYAFSRIIGSAIGHVNGDITHVQQRRREMVGSSVAICQEVMKSGKHYAEFTITGDGIIYVGIIRPIHGWSKKRMKHGEFRAYCQNWSGPGYVGDVHQFYFVTESNNLLRKGRCRWHAP